MERSSGILLHVSSLPGADGIGDLGPAAYAWVDQLARAKQRWWQMLPLGPTGYADSPYQCFSAFAGNPNFVSLELLSEEGLLERKSAERGLRNAEWGQGSIVDYDRVRPLKEEASEEAFGRFKKSKRDARSMEFERFCDEEAEWLDDFAVFVALKERQGGAAWWEWPAEDRLYDARRRAKVASELSARIDLCKFRQFLFFRQWARLRHYAHARGVRLIGDMPIFVAEDSADVWSQPELFQLDKQRRPAFVAGVPPDYFSATGQLWGNPLYDWERHRETGYAWWISRLKSTLKLVDLVRLDHFRGFEAYWAVPAGSETAEPGSWQPGPGAGLIGALEGAVGIATAQAERHGGRSLQTLPLIAEDLGVITPEVDSLRRRFGLPGMRILQFAFAGAQEDRFFPHHYEQHTVVYTGTHDNETTAGWFENLTEREREYFEEYAPGAARDPAWGLMRLAWASVADLAVAPLQDVLRLGNEARMNLPGSMEGNWRWRAPEGALTEELVEQLAAMTEVYQRDVKDGQISTS